MLLFINNDLFFMSWCLVSCTVIFLCLKSQHVFDYKCINSMCDQDYYEVALHLFSKDKQTNAGLVLIYTQILA